MQQGYEHLSSDRVTAVLATALARLPMEEDNTIRIPAPFPTDLRRAINLLTAAISLHGRQIPQSLPAILELLHQPLRAWPLPMANEYGDDEGLLNAGELTELCHYFVVNAHDVEAELTERLMLRVMDQCRNTLKSPESYTAFRYALVCHPVLDEYELLELRSQPLLRSLSLFLAEAYEDIPAAAIDQHEIRLCPRCKWTLTKTLSNQWRCGDEWCLQVAGHFALAERRPYTPHLKRVKRPLRQYVVAPGIAEVRIAQAIKRRLPHLDVVLWPNYDAYDIHIGFTDTVSWAVDVKDVRNAIRLATDLSKQEFRQTPPWERAWYVLPDERDVYLPGYWAGFRNTWRHPNTRITPAMERTFLQQVDRRWDEVGHA